MTTHATNPEPAPEAEPALDYPYIRAWCRYMGSFPYYVRDQLVEARRDKAPERAIYKRIGGPLTGELTRWFTVDECAPSVQLAIAQLVDQIRREHGLPVEPEEETVSDGDE